MAISARIFIKCKSFIKILYIKFYSYYNSCVRTLSLLWSASSFLCCLALLSGESRFTTSCCPRAVFASTSAFLSHSHHSSSMILPLLSASIVLKTWVACRAACGVACRVIYGGTESDGKIDNNRWRWKLWWRVGCYMVGPKVMVSVMVMLIDAAGESRGATVGW